MEKIKTENGYVSGLVMGEPGKNVYVYRGIPYAAPPIGEWRWKPPQPAISWSGTRDCTVYGDAAPQEPPGPPYPQESRSENCLTLNVLTPTQNPADKLPVMVWLHGGGYVCGCANNQLYSSIPLPQHGVVLVTVNHRLGLIGLMTHPLLSKESPNKSSGNYMLLDIIASLKWVQKNISAFGGDPNNVTIFGESGGGGKVTCLMASPLAEGLFHRAICESGTVMPRGILGSKTLPELEALGEKFFAKLGIDKEKDQLKAARAIPWQKLLEVEKTLAAEVGETRNLVMLWDTTADGWILPDTPTNIFKAGKHNTVPLLVGANLGELSGHAMLLMPQVIPAYVNQLGNNLKAGSKGYAYIFDQVPPGWRRNGMTAIHGMEVNYVFGLSKVSDWETVFPGPANPNPELSDSDSKVAETMMRMWAQFAKTGVPSIPDHIEWPVWEPATDLYLYITDPLQVRAGFSKIVPQ